MNSIDIKIVTYKDNYAEIDSLRQQAFQKQQGIVPELQDDTLDFTSMHLLVYLDTKPIATVRIKDLTPEKAQIERLAILATIKARKIIGQKIIQKALNLIEINDFKTALVVDREHRLAFYQQLGFSQSGTTFQKLGITYIKMAKQLETIENINDLEADEFLPSIGS